MQAPQPVHLSRSTTIVHLMSNSFTSDMITNPYAWATFTRVSFQTERPEPGSEEGVTRAITSMPLPSLNSPKAVCPKPMVKATVSLVTPSKTRIFAITFPALLVRTMRLPSYRPSFLSVAPLTAATSMFLSSSSSVMSLVLKGGMAVSGVPRPSLLTKATASSLTEEAAAASAFSTRARSSGLKR